MDVSLLTFAVLALIVVMTPGPTVLLALSNGSRFGVVAAGYGIAGAALSDVVLIAAAGLGLGVVLSASAVLFNVLRWIGVVYLIWLGVQMFRSSGALAIPTSRECRPELDTRQHRGALFQKSFLVAVTNPKGYLFFTAFLPQFLVSGESLLLQYATLAVVFIAIDVAVMALYVGFGVRAVQFLNDRGVQWMEKLCGGFFVSMGLALALVKRGDV
jgi:threonine/homoserine/homoserine lactone efflux protein